MQTDIIRMAREADLFEHVPLTGHVSFIYDLMEFAALVAAAEREACADIADQQASIEGIAQNIADAIRARKDKQ